VVCAANAGVAPKGLMTHLGKVTHLGKSTAESEKACVDMGFQPDLSDLNSMQGDAKADWLIHVLSNPKFEGSKVEACFVPNFDPTVSDANGPPLWIQGIYNMHQLMDIAHLFFLRLLTPAAGEVFKQICAAQLKIINEHKKEAKCGNDGYWELGLLGPLLPGGPVVHIPAKNVVWGSWMQQHPVGALSWCHDGSGIANHHESSGKALLDADQQVRLQGFRQTLFELMQEKMDRKPMAKRLKKWKVGDKHNLQSFIREQLRWTQPFGYKVAKKYW